MAKKKKDNELSEIELIRQDIDNANFNVNSIKKDNYIELKIILSNFKVKAYQRNRFARGGHSYDPLNSYKNEIKKKLDPMITKYIDKPYEGYCFIDIKYFSKITKNESTKKNLKLLEEGKLFPAKKPDLDNIEKILFDIFNKVIYLDDAQIIETKSSKYYDLEEFKTEIYIKIFKNKGEI